ncbi:hypothetical protein [Aquitalea sp. LB_tupeE]|uniref:hypothetical protein n=1 Tax=Aquitalea sp. LB_tupeE TaxID=2748078 RepID=UPI0015BD69E0|nr:hypothetical protein [Aquitalea sp. LB_tupeE]NWK79555.1 hypothetical protein [Aquitalea sp. LB_tupeE]
MRQPYSYGVSFDVDQYRQLASVMRSCQGRVMVSINDHPDIRAAFDGFWMEGLDIKYSISNNKGKPEASRELVITNWRPAEGGEGCFRGSLPRAQYRQWPGVTTLWRRPA